MNFKSERGQSTLVFVLFIGIIAVALILMMAGNQRGMQQGANTIGNAVGNAIEATAYDQDFENLVWEAQNAVCAWVGGQRGIYPNKHAIARHGADAWAVTDCYNRNGTFHVMKTSSEGIHLLCQDNDGKVRDMILKQRGSSSEFDFDTAFTPKDGTLRNVLDWIRRKAGASKFTMPENSTIYVDGVATP